MLYKMTFLRILSVKLTATSGVVISWIKWFMKEFKVHNGDWIPLQDEWEVGSPTMPSALLLSRVSPALWGGLPSDLAHRRCLSQPLPSPRQLQWLLQICIGQSCPLSFYTENFLGLLPEELFLTVFTLFFSCRGKKKCWNSYLSVDSCFFSLLVPAF